jgi:hypothetical protein
MLGITKENCLMCATLKSSMIAAAGPWDWCIYDPWAKAEAVAKEYQLN